MLDLRRVYGSTISDSVRHDVITDKKRFELLNSKQLVAGACYHDLEVSDTDTVIMTSGYKNVYCNYMAAQLSWIHCIAGND